MSEVLIGQRRILEKVFSYYMLTQETDEGCQAYGVKISDSSGGADTVSDLTISREQCLALIERLIKYDVTETTLRDVVEDWLLRE